LKPYFNPPLKPALISSKLSPSTPPSTWMRAQERRYSRYLGLKMLPRRAGSGKPNSSWGTGLPSASRVDMSSKISVVAKSFGKITLAVPLPMKAMPLAW
jgi:hypothetical protein